jgi:S1-C subfamily serine protease
MPTKGRRFASAPAVVVLLVAGAFALMVGGASAEDTLARIAKLHEPYTTTVALEFRKKNQGPIIRFLTAPAVFQPNGHATGVLVGDGLLMTSYHVVSGALNAHNRRILSFKPDDVLDVSVYVNGCQAKVVKSDPQADLALLQVCTSQQTQRPTFGASPRKDEPLLLIAQPGGEKLIRRGSFNGSYAFGNAQYLSVKIDGQDGFSGSPVYDDNGGIVGIFSLYDWQAGVALLTPAESARQLLAGYGG